MNLSCREPEWIGKGPTLHTDDDDDDDDDGVILANILCDTDRESNHISGDGVQPVRT
jgi:hypothetical protein